MADLKTIFHKLKQLLDARLPEQEREAISFLILEHFGYSPMEVHKDGMSEIPSYLLEQIIERVNRQEPIQYILGQAWFYGRNFTVRPGVLIPRPETELLIDLAKKAFPKEQSIDVLDLGTGSGCIPVTLAAECPKWNVTATDISSVALEVAKENAARHQINVTFMRTDMLKESPEGTYHLITSNPPYIPYSNRERLQPQVVEYEPHEALFSPDEDPLIFYRVIANHTNKLLQPGGRLIVEIQDKTGGQIRKIFEQAGLGEIEVIPDMDNKERFVQAIKPA